MNKTCAGWVTPSVFEILQIDRSEYRNGRVLQPIHGFRTGLIGGREIETRYDKIVSYGIRRCEFDTYLLNRCGAMFRTGQPVRSLVRRNECWQINKTWEAPLLVGAGGHFCPVAKYQGAREVVGATVVTAQETEFEASDNKFAAGSVLAEVPELFFCDDLNGYGWCFRKGPFLNIGLGRVGPDHLTSHVEAFIHFLRECGKVVAPLTASARVRPEAFAEVSRSVRSKAFSNARLTALGQQFLRRQTCHRIFLSGDHGSLSPSASALLCLTSLPELSGRQCHR